MTNKRWKQIEDIMEAGDPIKDIGCDEQELYEYCVELMKRLVKAENALVRATKQANDEFDMLIEANMKQAEALKKDGKA